MTARIQGHLVCFFCNRVLWYLSRYFNLPWILIEIVEQTKGNRHYPLLLLYPFRLEVFDFISSSEIREMDQRETSPIHFALFKVFFNTFTFVSQNIVSYPTTIASVFPIAVCLNALYNFSTTPLFGFVEIDWKENRTRCSKSLSARVLAGGVAPGRLGCVIYVFRQIPQTCINTSNRLSKY